MNEQKNNGRGIFYGVIGVATLVIAIIGATFAYFTATQTAGNNVITGNMATIKFDLSVKKVSTADTLKQGMIPMSNTMVERAFLKKSDSNQDVKKTGDEVCTDDNGNAVCQVYKITVKNTGSASLFLDGYVTLEDDVSNGATISDYNSTTNHTSMRWAQVFCTENESDGSLTGCTTAGVTTTRVTETNVKGLQGTNWDVIAKTSDEDSSGLNKAQILTARYTTDSGDLVNGIISSEKNGTIQGNKYDIIDTNFIRTSDHNPDSTSYDRTSDVTSALVYNQPLDANNFDDDDNDGHSGTTGFSDAQVYYIVVWFVETGYNQTQNAGTTGWDDTEGTNPDTYHFFTGNTTFVSAQGSEVTATFSGLTRVERAD